MSVEISIYRMKDLKCSSMQFAESNPKIDAKLTIGFDDKTKLISTRK